MVMVHVNSEDDHGNGDDDMIMMMTMMTHFNGCL